MRNVKVLDSSALLAYFEAEEGCDKVTKLLEESAEKGQNLLISVIQWGEVLYVIEGRYGKARRDEIEHLMSQMHLEVIDADKELTREAVRLKANTKLSYADSFAAALAKVHKAILITGDHDFKQVKNEIKIEWL